MGLTLPLALLGFAAVALPLWLHRTRRDALRRQPLPTVNLLARARSHSRPRPRFEDRLLLAVRCAMIALAALALAQPFMWREVGYAGGSPSALAIVIDDSMSMARSSSEAGSLLEAAGDRARQIAEDLTPGSEMLVVLAGHPPRVLVPLTSDGSQVANAVAALPRASQRGTDLEGSVSLARDELAASRLGRRQVLILSDCAAHAHARRVRSASPEGSAEFLCLESDDRRANARLSKLLLGPGSSPEKRAIRIEVRGAEGEGDLPVRLSLDGSTVARGRAVKIADSNRAVAELELTREQVSRATIVRAEFDLDDPLADDNFRAKLVNELAALQVLLVNGAPAPTRADDELRLLAPAISIRRAEQRPVKAQRIDAAALARISLDEFDVVVLANVPPPNEEQSERLSTFVRAGGGLLVAGGDHVEPLAYRALLGKLLPALPRGSAEAIPALGLSPETSPGAIPGGPRSLNSAHTSRRMLVERPPMSSQVALRFGDGTPALVMARRGAGQVGLWTTTLDDDWTDLPLAPGFLPMIQHTIELLAPGHATAKRAILAGDVMHMQAPPGTRELQLRTPHGTRMVLKVPEGGAVSFDKTGHAGLYRVYSNTDGDRRELQRMAFVVNADPQESSLGPAPPDAVSLDADGDPSAMTRKVRPLTPWIWLLLGVVAIAEIWLRPRQPAAHPGTS